MRPLDDVRTLDETSHSRWDMATLARLPNWSAVQPILKFDVPSSVFPRVDVYPDHTQIQCEDFNQPVMADLCSLSSENNRK